MQLLHIDSSILGANSVSRILSEDIVKAERRLVPGLNVMRRDLAANPLQHLSGAHLAAASAGAVGQPSPIEDDLMRGQQALEEFIAADIVVIGTPMYNFGIPSQLKAWIDRLAVAGKTFKYGPNGPEGLVGGKRVIVASSRGGFYGAKTAMGAFDHQENYLRSVFGFFGITDITFIRAEGVAMGDKRGPSIEAAKAEIAALV